MKKFVIAGTLAAAVAVAGTALAQQPAQTTPPAPAPKAKPATPPSTNAADQPAKPTKKATKKSSEAGEPAGHTAPKQQPNTATDPNATPQAVTLGTVRIPNGVKADGKDLPAGTYTVRMTAEEAKPDARGAAQALERWAEFVKGGQVVAREMVTVIPASEIHLVQKDAAPPPGGSKVQTLRGGNYLRLWFNKAGNHYLVHLPKA